MQFKTTLALVAALAALGEASPHRRHARRDAGSSARVSYVTVHPVPLYPSGTGASSSSDVAPVEPTTSITMPLSTGVPVSSPLPTGPVSTETITLTYTLGKGPSKTIVTKTISRPALAKPTDAPNETYTPPKGGNGPGGEITSLTTTISTTSTTTRTVTLYPTNDASAPDGGSNGGIGGDNGGNNKAPCVPVTETVTVRETYTVTVPAVAQPTEDAEPGKYPGSGNEHSLPAVPTTEESPVIVPIPTSVSPPPYANGTVPTTSCYSSSGFVTKPTLLPTGGQ